MPTRGRPKGMGHLKVYPKFRARLFADVRRLRQLTGITQGQLAAMLGVGVPYISYLETGKRKHPSATLILRYRAVEKVLQREVARRRKVGLQSLRWGRGAMKRLRHRAGIAQHRLAAMLGVSASHITHLECGRNKPSANLIFRYRVVEKRLCARLR